MDSSIRIDGLRELRRGLKAVEKAAPRELNKALKKAGTEQVLPKANASTPRLSGVLAGANRVTTKGDRVLFRNAKPYANTQHWGRKRLTRGGVTFPSVVQPRPYFSAAVIGQSDEITELVFREIERFIERQVP